MMTLRALTSASDAVACEPAVSDGCFSRTSTTLHRRSSFLFTLRLPAYTGWAFLLTRGERALRARWSASGIPRLDFLADLRPHGFLSCSQSIPCRYARTTYADFPLPRFFFFLSAAKSAPVILFFGLAALAIVFVFRVRPCHFFFFFLELPQLAA